MVSRITAKASWPTAVRTDVVGADQVARVDISSADELVDLDGARRFQRDLLELLLGDLDVLAFVELVALDDVLVGHLVPGVGIDLQVLDPMAGCPVELVERDLLALGRGRIERHRTGDKGQTQEAFPVGTGSHVRGTPKTGAAWIQDERGLPVPTCRPLSRDSSKGRRAAMGNSGEGPLDSKERNGNIFG
jgi:hypothetical protein